MDHKLIMENWRGFLEEAEQSELLDEGVLDTLRNIGLGLALAGGVMAPVSQAQAKPVASTSVGDFYLKPQEIRAIQRQLMRDFKEVGATEKDPKKRASYVRAAKILQKKLGATLGMEDEQNIGKPETYGYDKKNPNSPASQAAIGDAAIVQAAYVSAREGGHLDPQTMKAAEELERQMQTPSTSGKRSIAQKFRDNRYDPRKASPEQQRRAAEYAKEYRKNNPQTSGGR